MERTKEEQCFIDDYNKEKYKIEEQDRLHRMKMIDEYGYCEDDYDDEEEYEEGEEN